MTPSPATRTDVLIAGAGPVGLALACELQRRRIPHLLIDPSPSGFPGSRAKAIQPRTLEVLDDLGALDAVQDASALYPPLGIHLGPLTLKRTMITHRTGTTDVPHPNTLLVPQHATDKALRDRLAALGGHVTAETALTGFSQDPDGCTAIVEGPDGERTIRAAFLVGADGGSSTVRKAAGITFTGTTDESDRMIVADLSISGLSRERWHVWPGRSGRFMALCPLPDGRFQLMLKLRPDQPAALEKASLEGQIQRRLGHARVTVDEVHWTSVWRPNIRLAERYRHGRVLLAGDAAHVHPPTGGQGLNTGIQDAYNLGWKLAAALDGAPDALLDTYEAERRPVAANVLGLASKLYADTANRPAAATSRGDAERQLGVTYRGGPLAPEAPSAARVRAGDRAPDAPVTASDGRRTTVHEELRGTHFTVMTLGEDLEDASPDWSPAGAEVRTVVLDPIDNEALRRTYGLGDGPARLVVRPDGYLLSVAREPGDRLPRAARLTEREAGHAGTAALQGAVGTE